MIITTEIKCNQLKTVTCNLLRVLIMYVLSLDWICDNHNLLKTVNVLFRKYGGSLSGNPSKTEKGKNDMVPLEHQGRR